MFLFLFWFFDVNFLSLINRNKEEKNIQLKVNNIKYHTVKGTKYKQCNNLKSE